MEIVYRSLQSDLESIEHLFSDFSIQILPSIDFLSSNISFFTKICRLVGQVGGGDVRCKVLLRAGWIHMFCIRGFENVSPGEGSDWVKETHCYKSRMEIFMC